jgi:Phage integrase, N-terminal SAM-like domain
MFQPYRNRANEGCQSMPKTEITLNKFVQEWRSGVAANLKGSTVRTAGSHLRAHIVPRLGNLRLTEITTKAAQGFVAHLGNRGRSKKTVENVLLTLSSILGTAGAAPSRTEQNVSYPGRGVLVHFPYRTSSTEADAFGEIVQSVHFAR